MLPARPQTAAVRSTGMSLEQEWMNDPNFDPKAAQNDIDRELEELVIRNQNRLMELHQDFK